MAKRIKIVHVVNRMNHGGIEMWLMNVLRNIDRGRFHFTFCTTSEEAGSFDEEIRSLGADIAHCPASRGYREFSRRFLSLLATVDCDVVHSHSLFFSGLVLRLAKKARVPVRIAHVHTSQDSKTDSFKRRIYRRVMKRLIRRCATNGIGCSAAAADFVFGSGCTTAMSCEILPCTVDTTAFELRTDRAQFLTELRIPLCTKVIGHVGSFRPVKNQRFLIQMLDILAKRNENIYLVLVGDGPLKQELKMLAATLGITDRVRFTGLRNDVPQLMMSLFDLFLFPSLFEGLPVTLLEAQCAGVRCLISDTVTDEVVIADELVSRKSLTAGAAAWAEKALELLSLPAYDKKLALEQTRRSKFSIDSSIEFLSMLYTKELACHQNP